VQQYIGTAARASPFTWNAREQPHTENAEVNDRPPEEQPHTENAEVNNKPPEEPPQTENAEVNNKPRRKPTS
jgi:hypothetical protein